MSTGTTERVQLRHDRGVCPIVIGDGVLERALGELEQRWSGRTVFRLTTSRVASLYAERVDAILERTARRLVPLEAPDGEQAKSLEHAGRLWREMMRAGGKRDSWMFNLGGGSVGDLGGFVAASFLRGIPFVQLPTTLLAQVDASVGGKTGVDLPEAKNAVGAFQQPAAVVADTGLLETLPARELRAGLAEVVKMAAALDAAEFEWLETELDRVLERDSEALARAVANAVRLKVAVVEEDSLETGRRQLLNFGHTLGHAVESVLGYEQLLHGEAVVHGIGFALRLARRVGLDRSVADRIAAAAERLAPPPLPELSVEALLDAIDRDKKAREEGRAWVLPTALGRAEVRSDLSRDLVREELERFLAG